VGEQFLRVAGIFASDDVDLFQDAEGAQGNVFEVADGSADDVEATAAGRGGGRRRSRWPVVRIVAGALPGHSRSLAPLGGECRARDILTHSATVKGELLCLCTSTNA